MPATTQEMILLAKAARAVWKIVEYLEETGEPGRRELARAVCLDASRFNTGCTPRLSDMKEHAPVTCRTLARVGEAVGDEAVAILKAADAYRRDPATPSINALPEWAKVMIYKDE